MLAALSVPAAIALALAPNIIFAAGMVAVWAFLSVGTYGPLMCMLQSQVSSRMRGTVTALNYLMSFLVGVSLGSLIVGVVSDRLYPRFGVQSLRYGLLAMAVFYAWGALHFLLAARSFRADQARVD